MKIFFFKKMFFWPRRWSKLKKLRFLAIKRDFLSKNTIFAIKMAKMTQIGQKLAKINFLALSNFSPHRFAIFSFLTILWLKMTHFFLALEVGVSGYRISGLPDIRCRISAKCRISGIRHFAMPDNRILPDTAGFSEICPNLPKFCPNYPVIWQLSGNYPAKNGYPAGYPAKTDIRLSGIRQKSGIRLSGIRQKSGIRSGYPVSGKKSLSGTPLPGGGQN
jgi:hypothetical protein